MTSIILDPEVAAFIGAPLGNLGDTNPETDLPFIDQNGVRPGRTKLAQFVRAMRLRGVPRLYSQENKGDDALVYVKLFDPTGSWSWYVTEFSPTAPDGVKNLAFGLVHGWERESGYISIEELSMVKGSMGIGIEIDCWFKPCTIGDLKEKLSKRQEPNVEVVNYQ